MRNWQFQECKFLTISAWSIGYKGGNGSSELLRAFCLYPAGYRKSKPTPGSQGNLSKFYFLLG